MLFEGVVAIADVQHGLVVMRLPERNSALGWISGQHAAMMRNGLKAGAWRPRSPPEEPAPPGSDHRATKRGRTTRIRGTQMRLAKPVERHPLG